MLAFRIIFIVLHLLNSIFILYADEEKKSNSDEQFIGIENIFRQPIDESQSGRFTIFQHPGSLNQTFLLDTVSGNIWQLSEDPKTKEQWFSLIRVQIVNSNLFDAANEIEHNEMLQLANDIADGEKEWENLSLEDQERLWKDRESVIICWDKLPFEIRRKILDDGKLPVWSEISEESRNQYRREFNDFMKNRKT